MEYQGEMKNGIPHGEGILYYPERSLRTSFHDRMAHTKYESVCILQKSIAYKGHFSNGKFNGKGKKYYPKIIRIINGRRFDCDSALHVYYNGDWKDNNFNGYGTIYYKNDIKHFQGNFSKGSYTDSIVEYYETGAVKYKGSWDKFKYHGKGNFYYDNGQLRYSGNFIKGFYSGDDQKNGTEYFPGGSIKYQGTWNYAGDYNGQGTLYDSAGKVVYTGKMIDGLTLPEKRARDREQEKQKKSAEKRQCTDSCITTSIAGGICALMIIFLL